MLGLWSAESLAATLAIGHMTFFSRSKQRLWTKGEQSGNVLVVQSISVDCDADTLLVMARPAGPTCHTGAESCFDQAPKDFLGGLGQLVAMRERNARRAATPPACSRAASAVSHRRWARRAWRPPWRRWRRMRRCWARPPTCCTTCWCCCARAGCRWTMRAAVLEKRHR
jgi:hypothetical protein